MDDADTRLMQAAVALLIVQGHLEASQVLRSTRRLIRPAAGTRFGGRWQLWIDPEVLPAQPFDATQQIKRALNAAAGVDASYTDLHVM